MKRCAVCHCYSEELLCNGCRNLIKPTADGCQVCDKPLVSVQKQSESQLCRDCRKQRPAFDRIYCAGVYQPPGSDWVMALKFSNHLHWARAMAELMVPTMTQLPAEWPLIPMPLHPKRLKKRGYNQAHEISRFIAQFTNRRILSDLLTRTKYTAMQATLPEKKRRANVRQAFTVNGHELPETVILVDDVLTTGQTLSAAAAILKKAGVNQVYGVVFLRSDN